MLYIVKEENKMYKYKCEDCGQIFEEPKVSTDSVEYFGAEAQLESKICPYCDSEYIYEAHICKCCGENYIDTNEEFCNDCKTEMEESINGIVEYFINAYGINATTVFALMDECNS